MCVCTDLLTLLFLFIAAAAAAAGAGAVLDYLLVRDSRSLLSFFGDFLSLLVVGRQIRAAAAK